MKLKYCIISSFIVLGGLCSCADVLDTAPDGRLSMKDIFADPTKVGAFLNTCYNHLPRKGYFYWGWDPAPVSLSDDAWTSGDGGSGAAPKVYRGQVSASDHPVRDAWLDDSQKNTWCTNNYWARYWQQIRLCTQFIENIDDAAVNSEIDRDRFRAEAHVLRAYFYSELVKWFGKVPVVRESIAFDADFSGMRRESVYDVVKFIEEDCDAAIYSDNLPWRITTASEGLRMTKAVAWAIKSKMMLFAASPLFNEGMNHWEEAYIVNRDAVNALKNNGYELFKECTNPTTYGTGKAAAFRQLFNTAADYVAEPRDKETIWQHVGHTCFVWHIGYIGSKGMNGIDGTYACGACPTQELVDAFNTLDGEPVLNLENPYNDEKHLLPNYNSRNTQYNPDDPFANRDPRMEETLMHNGSTFVWSGETKTVQTYKGGYNEINLNPGQVYNTRTGYYHCKFVQPGACKQNGIQTPAWKFFRLAEIILDYAEAAAEAGHLTDAKDAVDEIRARVGMPKLPAGLSQKEMILRVRNERQVELAWEECRYFDLRRWQQPDGDLSESCQWLTGMEPIKQSDGTFKYERYSISQNPRGGCETRDLLLPVPVVEAARLEAVTGESWQNPGW
ncbi:RagB/SusD family nutrient uptake outer membrane protein [Bacteroides congonensis]|uniref:RagB/SusD family nutrient uptake outer membrane protein n=1 Tax=Bacteroides TaxID=816 RepID=UPI001898EB10|nr:RagB/SusD family nutrient uptake outer membrane protein [Bacteroides congonensis]